ncbi:MAG: S-layer homology domain-containing protein [Clostridia bacterium]|nr:S-layer homology domain-containing protein [Clostridia bacterium]
MKNLKKTLAVVLAFAMVFSMGIINTFAFSDVEAGTVVDEAVGILSNLKIIEGFEDGTFKPEETITRAQMAAIICRTLGYEAQAQSSKGTTAFTDVAADSWASGYINVAHAQGIINGYGNGLFGPNDKVTYEQAVKMIVAALGYDIAAAGKGGYPTGYLAIASAEGITKNANGRVGDAASRATVAVLVYNSLEVRIMDQKSWSTDGTDSYGKTAHTILSKYLEVNKWEGVLVEDAFTNFAENGYEEDAVEKISLDDDATYKLYNYDGDVIRQYEYGHDDVSGVTGQNVNASLVDTTGLLGKKVIAYIGAYEDAESGEAMVYAINEKSGANKSVEINALQLATDYDKADSDDFMIYYTNPGSTKIQKLELEDGDADDDIDEQLLIYVNYEVSDATVEDTLDLADLLPDGGVIEFVSNDTDAQIEYINIKAYEDESVIEEVEEDEGVFAFELYNGGDLDEIDTTDEDALYIVYKDGEAAEVKDIAANDTVSWFELGTNSNVFMLYVSSKTLTGAVESYDDEVVVINGEEYELTNGTPADLAGEEGTFFLNVDGKIAWNETDAVTSGTFGILLAIAQGDNFDAGVYEARVALADGTVAIYELAKAAKFYDADGDKVASTAKDTANAVAGSTLAAGDSVVTTYDAAVDSIYKFSIKEGKIASIKSLETTPSSSNPDKAYDADANSYGSLDFAEDAVVFAFNADEEDEDIEANKLSVGTISAYFTDKEDGKVFYAIDEDDDGYEELLLGFNLVPGVPEDSAVVVITGRRNVTYNDDDAVQITGIQAGKEVTYTLYSGEDNDFDISDEQNHVCTTTGPDACIEEAGEKCDIAVMEASFNKPTKLAKGDVILVSTPSAEGVVSNYRLIYSAAYDKIPSVAAGIEEEGLFTVVADLEDVENDRFVIDEDIENALSETFAAAGDGIRMPSSANYTLVDYTESTKNPVIKGVGAKSAVKVSSKYTSRILIRIYDEKIVDVVVYRTAA